MAQIEFAKYVRDYLLDYIKFADTKAAALLTIVAALGSVVGFSAERFFEWAAKSQGVVAASALLLIAVFVLSAAMAGYHCLTALNPAVQPEHGALCSFPDVAKMQHSDYVQQIAAIDNDRVVHDIASHTHTLSKIASAKFSAIRSATQWLGLLLLTVTLIVLMYAATGLLRKDDGRNAKSEKQNSSVLFDSPAESSDVRADYREGRSCA